MLTKIGHNMSCLAVTLLMVFAGATSAALGAESGQEGFEGWSLKPGLEKAHVVIVARVVSVGRLTVVKGAKADVALREYRFQPVRRLKGIFQRDELSMTASDLGLPPENESSTPALKEGEFRLLILSQQQGDPFDGLPTFGCVSAAPGATTFEERVPLLNGPEDPLVGVVETLIKVADCRSRRRQAELLFDQMMHTDGVSVVPILTSLQSTADWAATDERAYEPIVRLVRSRQTAVRAGALAVLRDMLAIRAIPDGWRVSSVGNDPKRIDVVGAALCDILKAEEANTGVRVAAIEALGNWFAFGADIVAEGKSPGAAEYAQRNAQIGGARDLLIKQSTKAATYAERIAAVAALSRIEGRALGNARNAIVEGVETLPLDEQFDRESVYIRALVRLVLPDYAKPPLGRPLPEVKVLLDRLRRLIEARQSLQAEVDALGGLRSAESLALLLSATGQSSVSSVDRQHIAWALGRLGDDSAVPVLVKWLRGNEYQVRGDALAALEKIDTKRAAEAVRPLLKSEPQLPYKLRIARLLARHGFDDGYTLATEHLSDAEHTAEAALILVALDDPRTADDLSTILKARPDRRWQVAALTGLAAIGDADARKQLREILADERNPLAADAAQAAGLTADASLLPPLAKLVRSRNKQIATASLIALRRFLSGVRTSPQGLAAANVDNVDREDVELFADAKIQPSVEVSAATRDAIRESVASLLLDTYVDAEVRQEAFLVARRLGGKPYRKLLTDVADQAELEGTPLLAQVRAELRRSREPVGQIEWPGANSNAEK